MAGGSVAGGRAASSTAGAAACGGGWGCCVATRGCSAGAGGWAACAQPGPGRFIITGGGGGGGTAATTGGRAVCPAAAVAAAERPLHGAPARLRAAGCRGRARLLGRLCAGGAHCGQGAGCRGRRCSLGRGSRVGMRGQQAIGHRQHLLGHHRLLARQVVPGGIADAHDQQDGQDGKPDRRPFFNDRKISRQRDRALDRNGTGQVIGRHHLSGSRPTCAA